MERWREGWTRDKQYAPAATEPESAVDPQETLAWKRPFGLGYAVVRGDVRGTRLRDAGRRDMLAP